MILGATLGTPLFWGENLQAQEMMAGGEHGGEGMTRMHAFSPHHLLMHGDAIGLTSGQREALMRIQHEAAQTHEIAKARHDQKRAEMMALFSDGGDLSAAEETFALAHAAGGEAHWAGINAAIQAMALLDEVQLARANGWADMMEMMGKMGAGGMGDSDEGHDEDGDGEMGGMRH